MPLLLYITVHFILIAVCSSIFARFITPIYIIIVRLSIRSPAVAVLHIRMLCLSEEVTA